MRFRCSTEKIVAALSVATRALSARTPQQILECVKLDAEDGRLRFTGSDGIVSIVTSIAADIEEEGAAVLPGRLLLDACRKMPSGALTAQAKDNFAVQLSSGTARMTLSGQDARQYPPLPETDAQYSLNVPQPALKDMITRTMFAMAEDDERAVLTGTLFEIVHSEITVVAIDGFRLALRHLRLGQEVKDMRAIIPGKTLSEMVKVLEDDEEKFARINFGERQMTMDIGDTRLYSTLIAGEFINYKSILNPNDFNTQVRVPVEALRACVDRASLMARSGKNNLVKLAIDGNVIVMTSNSENGDVYEELDVEQTGESLTIAFNVRYLSDVLSALKEEAVDFRFKSNVSPCVVCPVEGDNFTYLILPVRVSS
jgi:DNA polymerase-3 subunit beta